MKSYNITCILKIISVIAVNVLFLVSMLSATPVPTLTPTPDYSPTPTPCVNDSFEPNQNCLQPATISAGFYPGLVICPTSPSDNDFYNINVGSNESIKATITFDRNVGNLNIRLYEENCGGELAYDITTPSGEYIWYYSSTVNNVNLRIWAGIGVSNFYDLNIVFYPTTPTPTPTPCSSDIFESNDVCSQSALINSGYYPGLALCDDDVDWFGVYASNGEKLVIQTVFTFSGGNTYINLYDLNCGSFLETSIDGSNYSELYYDVPDNGTYFFKVDSPWSDYDSGYDLNIHVIQNTFTPTPTFTPVFSYTPTDTPTPCIDDSFEPNSHCSSVVPISPGFYPNLQLCAEDAGDVFTVSVDAGRILRTEITFLRAVGDLSLRLFWSNCGNHIQDGIQTSSGELLEYLISQSGSYNLIIMSRDDLGNSYDLNLQIFTVTPSPTPSFSPTETETPLPTRSPTRTPTNTLFPTLSPTNAPTETPTQVPTATETPISTMTATPSITYTPQPTITPTSVAIPGIRLAGYMETNLTFSGGMLQILALASNSDSVEVFYQGVPSGVELQIFGNPEDGVFWLQDTPISPGVPSAEILIELIASNLSGSSLVWPYLNVIP